VTALVHNLVLFGRVLRGLGLEVNPGRINDAVDALGHVPVGARADFRHALRCLLVRRREDLGLFDEAFDVFWRKPAQGSSARDLRAMGERRRVRPPRFGPAPHRGEPVGRDGHGENGPPKREGWPILRATVTYSPSEALRHKDFGALTAAEAAEVEKMVGEIAWRPGERRGRRAKAARGPIVDLRRTLRRSLRHGGEVLAWESRRRQPRPRPLVVLADVSGSMERYTRMLLLFLFALAAGLERRAEVFLFGTRLTRVTRQIRGRDPEGALREVARAVPDWSGGTRIGEVLGAFNRGWARRVLGGGAVVLLISDGWDRGDPGILSAEVARLQRTCHRLVWLNPLLAAPEYEPLARGMRAALPYVDDFLPVHDVASLEALAARLESLGDRRPDRRQHVRGVVPARPAGEERTDEHA